MATNGIGDQRSPIWHSPINTHACVGFRGAGGNYLHAGGQPRAADVARSEALPHRAACVLDVALLPRCGCCCGKVKEEGLGLGSGQGFAIGLEFGPPLRKVVATSSAGAAAVLATRLAAMLSRAGLCESCRSTPIMFRPCPAAQVCTLRRCIEQTHGCAVKALLAG